MTTVEILSIRKNRVLIWFGFGLGLILAAVAAIHSFIMAVAGLIVIIIAGWYGRRKIVCPYCGRSIYPYVIRELAFWKSRVPESCPLCAERLDREA